MRLPLSVVIEHGVVEGHRCEEHLYSVDTRSKIMGVAKDMTTTVDFRKASSTCSAFRSDTGSYRSRFHSDQRCLKMKEFTATVTMRERARRTAGSAAMSTIAMIQPPNTSP